MAFTVLPASAQSNTASAYTFTTLAGYALSTSADGLGPNARFSLPLAVAMDTNGNIFVADNYNSTIRKITPAGVVSTIAGLAGRRGFDDGINSAARFWSPSSIAVDPSGNVYVGDNFYYLIRKLTPVGTNWVVTTFAGQLATAGYRDSNPLNGGAGGRLAGPFGLAANSAGDIYIADGVIRKVTPTGFLSTIANAQGFVSFTSIDGFQQLTNFVGVFPGIATAIALDAAGEVFVADKFNHTIWQVHPVGSNWNVRMIAGASGISGSADGPGLDARFQSPAGIATDGLGNLFVTDDNHTIRKLVPDGTNWIVSTVAGSVGIEGNTDGVGTNALFASPVGIVADAANNLIVADSRNGEIRKVTAAGIVRTIAGSTISGSGTADGIGTDARFQGPGGVALDGQGNVYVADYGNHTIRMITSVGVVSTLVGSAGNPGTVDGIGSNARLNFPDGIAIDSSGNLFVAQYGDGAVRKITPAGVVSTIPGVIAYDIAVGVADRIFVVSGSAVREIFMSGNNWMVSTVATASGTLSAIAAAHDGRLFVLNGNLVQMLTPMGTNWIFSNVINLPTFAYHLAVDGAANIYVPGIGSRTVFKVTSQGANWTLTTIGGAVPQAPLYEGGNADGAGMDALFQIPYGIAADNAGNVFVSDAVNHNIRKGVFTQYSPTNAVAYVQPVLDAALVVTLLPPEADGQWRFPWELGWRNSGVAATDLVAGNYRVELRTRSGYLAIPPRLTVAVAGGGTTSITNEYFPTLVDVMPGLAGSLTVNIGPNAPAGAGWRFVGDNTPFFPPGYTTNLAPEIYLIEFASVSGRSKPASQAVQVFSGLPTVLSVNYLIATAPPAGLLLPAPVPTNQISDVSNYPFGFNGQLQSDIGFGSGAAVDANVVLTVAHLVFNDQTLSYVNQVYWYFRREVGSIEPQPLAARGYYLLSGYAAQRTNDLRSGLYAPDQSTPQSRNLDVAALYFLSPAAGGSRAGYLPSLQTPSPWLTGSALKMLVGYPVDGSLFGNASLVPGQMYQTDPQPYPLTLASDPVPGQQVYVAPWFLSYPGNSGGPFYAQFNGYFYPAGIYLGTLFNGSQPYASLVRAIDGDVVTLITLASSQGDSGTNNTGGGVITIIPSQGVSANNPGYMQFQLTPPAAVRAGAAWRLQGDSTYSTASNYTRAVTSTNSFAVEFKPIPGWISPTNQNVIVLPGQLTPFTAFYSVTNPLWVNGAAGFGITGTTGTVYRVEQRSSLATGSWLPRSTNTINSPGFNLILPRPPTNPPTTFYRLRWLP